MSNVFLFDTRTERDSFIMGPDYTIPHVSGLVDSEEITYNNRLVSFLNKLSTYHNDDELVAEECRKAVELSKNNLNFDKCILIQRVPITETQTDPDTQEEIEVETGCDYEYVEITPSNGTLTSTQTADYKANTVAVIFPYGIDAGANCFENATNLRVCNFEGMLNIGSNSFKACSNLTGSVKFRDNVALGAFAFRGTNLTSIPSIINTSTCDISAFSTLTCIKNLTINATVSVNARTDGGDGTGVLTINTPNAYIGQYTIWNYGFRYIIVNGNANCSMNGAHFLSGSTHLKGITINGDIKFVSNNSYFSYGGNNSSELLEFIEVTGTVYRTNTAFRGTFFYGNNFRCLSDHTIFHFAKTDGIVSSPDLVNASFSRVIKIYVGDGSSLENDQAVLDMYLADTDWATYSSKLDCWYNYTGEYKNG